MINTSLGLNKLADKLQSANKTIILQKRRQKEEIEDRLEALETQMIHKKKFENDSIERAKVRSEQLAKCSHQTMRNFSIKAEKEEEIVRNLKEQMENDLEFEGREHETRIDDIIEKSTEAMTSSMQAISKKAKNNSDKNKKMITQLTKSIQNLEREIQEEAEARQENCKRIKSDVVLQINKFVHAIQKEQERKTVSIRKLYEMMDEISDKLTNQVDSQSAKRAKNNEAILRLVEGACQKLEAKIRG